MLYCLKCTTGLITQKEHEFTRDVCPKCGWTFYNNPRPCVTAVIMRSEYILLTLRGIRPARGMWDLPGGFVEIGEHPADAIRREVHEELGVGMREVKLFGMYPNTYDPDEKIHTLDLVYLCRIEDDPVQTSSEIDEWCWFHLADLPDVYAFPSIKETIQDVKKLFGFA